MFKNRPQNAVKYSIIQFFNDKDNKIILVYKHAIEVNNQGDSLEVTI